MPLQLAKPGAQVGTPAIQSWLAASGRLQAPQLPGSVRRSTHDTPPHKVCPALQPVTHAVPLQTGVGLAQARLQLPQVWGSLAAASQPGLASQFKKPVMQPQVPAVQVAFVPQSLLHEPQVSGREKSASQPSSAIRLQSPKPGSHTQTLPLHSRFEPQLLPHAPQFPRSESVEVSQPSLAIPLQSSVPCGHVQRPSSHVASNGHSMPQLPQFSGSVAALTSQPLTTLWSQSRNPSAHKLVH